MLDPARVVEHLRVEPGRRVLVPRDFDPADTCGIAGEDEAVPQLRHDLEQIAKYHDRLAAQATHGILLVLQALDAAGKDGTIKHVMSGLNPSFVRVCSFKVPSVEEVMHTWLWRYSSRTPERGSLGIFNRSHYEEVLVVRVHAELLERQRLPATTRGARIWARRYEDINAFERHLVENGIRVVKVFLNISRDEQRRRFLERIDNPRKNWKFSAADARERRFWDDYMHAYSEALSHTSTEWAPWHVIPADHKWFSRLAVSALLLDTLRDIDPHYPTPTPEQMQELAAARAELEAE
ncbi:MAG TPA: polyphosphate kinase 2 family protein [Candidatus Dormibacteraeota bacterium]|jgi:PPK2 family polyphosphate:nucleotide phosphotransferase|nr:polyphosphate kinase 2 family protein [Candidatus Dormibacteraeota bacterium]